MVTTKQDYAIASAIRRQLGALGADHYRVTMMNPTKGMTYVPGSGKGPGGAERFFSVAEILKLAPGLSRRNWGGDYNVYVTPLSASAHYLLVDDLLVDTKSAMDKAGFVVALYIQTSWQKYQGVFMIPAEDLPAARTAKSADHARINRAFEAMNRQWGDPKITGQIHPIRLAGFQNRKPEHCRDGVYPLVRIHEARPGHICAETRKFVRDFKMTAPVSPPPAPLPVASSPAPAFTMAELVKAASEEYGLLRKKFGPDLDMVRADYMIAKDLIRMAGTSPAIAAAVLMAASPGIQGRDLSPKRYAGRTALRAAAAAAVA